MNTYWMFMKITVAEYMAYRMNFIMWRVRMVMQTLIFYFLWVAMFTNRTSIYGYTESTMLSYVMLTSFLRTYVLGTTTQQIGSYINEGRLTNYLLRPLHFFRVSFSRDIADKALNAAFSVIELTVLFAILRPAFVIQHDPVFIGLAVLSSLVAVCMFFFISLIVGFVGFWTPEVWAPRFLAFVIIEFFSGALFPVDILSQSFRNLAAVIPFQYLLYFPISVYLGKVTVGTALSGVGIAVGWTVLFYLVARTLWIRGLRVYEAQGR